MAVHVSTGNAPGAADGQGGANLHDFVEVYRTHDRRIFRYCLSYLRNTADAEDATQETFARAARRLDTISGDVGSYLTAIARNVCYDVHRYYPHQHVALEHLDESGAVTGSPETRAIDRSLLERVAGTLTGNERRLLVYAFAGYTYEEISRRTGMSAKAISVAITRARQRLRRLAAAGTLGALTPLAVWRWIQRTTRQALGNTAMTDALTAAAQPTVLLALVIASATTLTAMPYGGGLSGPRGTLLASATLPSSTTVANRARAGTMVTVQQPAQHKTGGRQSMSTPTPGPSLPAAPSLFQQPTTEYQAEIDSLTASPSYASDHTVFGTGTRVVGACPEGCNALFRSVDGGTTWDDVNSTTFPGGSVVIPASYSASDPTVYAMSSSGLLRSPDGGVNFTPALPVGPGVATAVPAGSSARGTVLVAPKGGGGTTWLYSAAAVTQGPTLPADLVVDALAYANSSTLVALEEPAHMQLAHTQLVVVACSALQCAPVASLAGDQTVPSLLVSPSYGTDHTVAAVTLSHVWMSSDPALTSFTQVTGVATPITSAAFVPGSAGAALLAAAYSGGAAALSEVAPGTTSAVLLASDIAPGYELTALSSPVAGRILGAMAPVSPVLGTPGVRCSHDATHWAWSC